jgi:hypothetical protein
LAESFASAFLSGLLALQSGDKTGGIFATHQQHRGITPGFKSFKGQIEALTPTSPMSCRPSRDHIPSPLQLGASRRYYY